MKKRVLLIALISVLALAGLYTGWTMLTLPDVRAALEKGVTPTKTSLILAEDGTVLMSQGKYYHRPVRLDEVSPTFINALLATEDQRFYKHHGIDSRGIARAVVTNIRTGSLREGGSSITQQLARNVFLSNERSLNRKFKEAILATRIEQALSKEEILELYLNTIYFGEGAYGIGAASEVYFGKPPAKLSLPEAALIAGLPQAPSRYNPFENPELAKKRRDEVLDDMVRARVISADEAARYKKAPVRLHATGRALSDANKAPFFNRVVLDEAVKRLNTDEKGFWERGVRVHTTLDYGAQRSADRWISEMSRRYGRTGKVQQVALISIDNKNGAILAYVGGREYGLSQFDRVTQAKRPAGSLFKVFVYTAAIRNGIAPQTVYRDEPVTFGNWSPLNYDRSFRGYMTLAQAVAWSNNVVAVKVANEVKPETVLRTARQLGVTSAAKPNLAIALGAVEVNLQEMTAAFSTYANNDGMYVTPYAIERITDREGRVVYAHQRESHPVLDRRTRDTMVRLLQGVVAHGTGRGAAIGRPAAGKTGTSDDNRDAWFIGFTPEITTGVWVGNDNNSRMGGITGGSMPAAIWRQYMMSRLMGKPVQGFDLSHAMPVAEKDFFEYDLHRLSRTERPVSLWEWLFERYPKKRYQATEPANAKPDGEKSKKVPDQKDDGDSEKAWGEFKGKIKNKYREWKSRLKELWNDE